MQNSERRSADWFEWERPFEKGSGDKGSDSPAPRASSRRWSAEEKARIVRESFWPGNRVGDVAQRYGLHRKQLSARCIQARRGKLARPSSTGPEPEPVAVVAEPGPESAFATLEVEEPVPEATPGPVVSVSIEARGVTVRLGGDIAAGRIAETASLLRALRCSPPAGNWRSWWRRGRRTSARAMTAWWRWLSTSSVSIHIPGSLGPEFGRVAGRVAGRLARLPQLGAKTVGRVAAGSCPPAAPADPGVPNSGTRLLERWSRCSAVHTVHDSRRGEGVGGAEAREALPCHAAPPASPAEPLAPLPFHFESESVQRLEVAGDAVVGVVTSQLAAQRHLLVAQFPVPMIPTPLTNSLQRSAESVLGGLAFDDPSPLPGASPIVSEPQHREAALALRAAPRRLRRTAKLHHPRLVRVQPEAVTSPAASPAPQALVSRRPRARTPAPRHRRIGPQRPVPAAAA